MIEVKHIKSPMKYLKPDNEIRQRICFLSDSWGYPATSTAAECAEEYAVYYPHFNRERFDRMMETRERSAGEDPDEKQ